MWPAKKRNFDGLYKQSCDLSKVRNCIKGPRPASSNAQDGQHSYQHWHSHSPHPAAEGLGNLLYNQCDGIQNNHYVERNMSTAKYYVLQFCRAKGCFSRDKWVAWKQVVMVFVVCDYFIPWCLSASTTVEPYPFFIGHYPLPLLPRFPSAFPLFSPQRPFHSFPDYPGVMWPCTCPR